jgi:hypothetical protein
MATHWIQMAHANAGMLASIFLTTCNHLAEHDDAKQYSLLALRYKSKCISMLKVAISQEGPVFRDTTIATTLALASDAVRTHACLFDLLIH